MGECHKRCLEVKFLSQKQVLGIKFELYLILTFFSFRLRRGRDPFSQGSKEDKDIGSTDVSARSFTTG